MEKEWSKIGAKKEKHGSKRGAREEQLRAELKEEEERKVQERIKVPLSIDAFFCHLFIIDFLPWSCAAASTVKAPLVTTSSPFFKPSNT